MNTLIPAKPPVPEPVLRLLLLGCLAWSGWAGAGCSTRPMFSSPIGPAYEPVNVYRAQPKMPIYIRRVALLPTTAESNNWQSQTGRRQLEPLLQAHLGKIQPFETVPIDPQLMRSWTGQTSWRTEEPLPADLLQRVHKQFGCQAVLFSHLRTYHGFKPIVIGWKFKLVEVPTGAVLWAADEVFDANDPAVARAASRFWENQAGRRAPPGEESLILSSPTRFGQYTLCALLETIPER